MLYPLYNLLTLRHKTCTQWLHIPKITLENPKSFHASTTLENIQEPISKKEALKCPKRHKAMQEKIEALRRNHTWTLVSSPHVGKVIGNK